MIHGFEGAASSLADGRAAFEDRPLTFQPIRGAMSVLTTGG